MHYARHFSAVVAFVASLSALAVPAAQAQSLDRIKLPPGFRIEQVTDQVPDARAMTFSPAGTLYVGSRGAGKVYAVAAPLSGKPQVHTVASGLTLPIGVAWRDGALYASSVSRIVRLDGIDNRLDNPPRPVVIYDKFPSETHHGGRFIGFGPDGYLYVPIGAPCNVCARDESRYANILRIKPDGSDLQVFAKGVRNTVGFDWHPSTGELWFSENGRDWLGDDSPPDELNRASRAGLHYGFPYCHAGNIADPEFGKQRACTGFEPPVARLGPHVAALGMRFYTGKQFPAEYRNNIFIAEHGSWNRSERIGYRITRVALDDSGKVIKQETFAEGWLQDGQPWGRPADVAVAPDGSLLVSDDLAGAIYRIRYAPQ